MVTNAFQVRESQAIQDSLRKHGVLAKVEFIIGPQLEAKPFGTLLALDFYECPKEKLQSVEHGYKFLEQIAFFLGMTMQSPPFIFLSDAKRFPDKAGLSGWVPLIESGITLHTIIHSKFATIDIYSCSNIPPVETISFTYKMFLPKLIEATFMYRGCKYPTP